MPCGMYQANLFAGTVRRFPSIELGEIGATERAFDRAQAFRTFRMAKAGIVFQETRMTEVNRGHDSIHLASQRSFPGFMGIQRDKRGSGSYNTRVCLLELNRYRFVISESRYWD